jgi:hypothetical protein
VLTYYALALLACAANLVLLQRPAVTLRSIFDSARSRAERAVVRIGAERCTLLAVAALVCLFFVQIHTMNALRLQAANDSRVSFDVTMFVLDVLQTLMLGLLYVSLSTSTFPRIVRVALFTSPVLMYGFAIWTTAISTEDLYAYVAYGKLGWHAYSPPNIPFTGPFTMLNAEIAWAWKTLEPAPYGPLFLALDWLVVAPAASVMQAVVALRLLDIAALGVCFVALKRLGFAAPLLAVVFLDPEIVFNYVVEGHNDVLAVAAILAAMALWKHNRIAAIVLAIAAGTIKAPYALLALLVSADESRLVRRLQFASIIAVGTVAVSVAGGAPYLHALTWHASVNGVAGISIVRQTIHALAAGVAIAAVGMAVVFRRTVINAVWTFPALAATLYTWYMALGIPYAVMERRHAATLFVLFPVGCYFLSFADLEGPTTHPAAVALILGIALFAFVPTRRRDRTVVRERGGP